MYLHAEIMQLRKACCFVANVITYNCKFSILYLDSDIAENNEKIYLLSFKEDFRHINKYIILMRGNQNHTKFHLLFLGIHIQSKEQDKGGIQKTGLEIFRCTDCSIRSIRSRSLLIL